MTSPAGGNPRPSGSMIVATFLIILVGVLVIGGSLTALQLPNPVTSQAHKTHTLYEVTLGISMIVYFGVTAGIIYAIFRFRKRGNELPQQIHGSSALELGWTVVPVLILVGLFIPSLLLVINLKTPPATGDIDMTVEAIGHQWYWEFVYCQKGEGPDECRDSKTNVHVQATPPNYNDLVPPSLVLPTDQTIQVYVRSTDVVHSFYWPHSLYKIQAVPGNINQMHFKIEDEGTFSGQCYQFCGLRHADMLFIVDARGQTAFNNWLNDQKKAQGIETTTDQAAQATPR
ncbi:MAG TPA: cytochrome c oxidase subunit II [Dehalococcoidia bacterium]